VPGGQSVYAWPMRADSPSLSRFHPRIAAWFAERLGAPTEVQVGAWERIAAGEHVLVTAPTGSGKTLAAFLWAIDRLLTGSWPGGQVSVLYVSPLKALNSDIERNLLSPLAELSRSFEREGEAVAPLRVATRSGDTPQADRRRMLRHPPEILITTPESLNLLLASEAGRSMFRGLRCTILDEIHAVVGNKRGTHLITAVDRLVPLAGEFQRIALSATVRPLEAVAEFVGGRRLRVGRDGPEYTPRSVSILRCASPKQYQVRVRLPEGARNRDARESIFVPLIAELKELIGGNRSTLIFVNSRRLCEKLTRLINADEDRPLAWAHHGSLSREIRTHVERKLKAGELRAIVATSSLELGIDVGALDEVVLIGAPPSVASALQRAGRAGHRVGDVSRVTLYPTHSQDLLETAVLAREIFDRNIEALEPIRSPLDVLAQIVVSMVGSLSRDIDELFDELRASHPYRELRRDHFDLVIDMLAGRYAQSRVRELQPRASIDRLEGTLTLRRGALQVLFLSGGTIPDRGYFQLRHSGTGGRIGELDEEFVWEAKVGNRFALGTQSWKIDRITHDDVFVTPAPSHLEALPFWKAEQRARGSHLSRAIAEFLERADRELSEPRFRELLTRQHFMGEAAAEELVAFLQRQVAAGGGALPHRHHLLVEHVRAGPGGAPGNQLVLHTVWGGSVNRPFGMAFEAAWEERFGGRVELDSDDDRIALQLPHELSAPEVLSLVTTGNVERLLRKGLERSGFFGARFREAAGRALLLTRRKFNQRLPLWMMRLRSQKLFDGVLHYDDFPILLETWRTCLQDEFDLPSLLRLLAELESGSIRWSEVYTSEPSPMARTSAWRQVNEYMYRGDSPGRDPGSSLRPDLVRELLETPELRPRVPRDLCRQFEDKRRRLWPGYSPRDSRELLDWVVERGPIPVPEWELLLAGVRRDWGIDPDSLVEPLAGRLVRASPPGAAASLVVAAESAPRVLPALYGRLDAVPLEAICGDDEATAIVPSADREAAAGNEALIAVVGEWLQFYAPRTVDFVEQCLGLDADRLELALSALRESRAVVAGELIEASDQTQICDAENFESLLRLARAARRPDFEPLAVDWLPIFLAGHQGLLRPAEDLDAFRDRLEKLLCHPAAVALWESEILPARCSGYQTAFLDSATQESGLRWVGSEGRKVAFCFEADLDLLREEAGWQPAPASPDSRLEAHFADTRGRYDFGTLQRSSQLTAGELSEELWRAAWQGRVSNDGFLALRRGIEARFELPRADPRQAPGLGRGRRAGGRAAFSRWQSALPFAGNWFLLKHPEVSDDPLEREERNRDRVRLLLDRYGILFRELLSREAPAFRWASLFRSLRLMELSGEVVAGCFFRDIPGLQFASHGALRRLQAGLPEDEVFWCNAADPASLCGVGLEALKPRLPRRVSGTHVVYRGGELVVTSQRNARQLWFRVPVGDPGLEECFGFLQHLLTRRFQPLRQIVVETINDLPAVRSPYLERLRARFDVAPGPRDVLLSRMPGRVTGAHEDAGGS